MPDAIEPIASRSGSGSTGDDRHATASTAARVRSRGSEIAKHDRIRSLLPDAGPAHSLADSGAVVVTQCPLCNRVESVVMLRCSLCRTILRRCFDCGSYDSDAQRCRAIVGLVIEIDDAEEPIEDSPSYLCQQYWPRPKRVGIVLSMADSASK